MKNNTFTRYLILSFSMRHFTLVMVMSLIITSTLAQFSLVRTIPQKNETNVPVNQSIILEFNELVDGSTIPGNLSIISNLRGEINGEVSLQNNIITFLPTEEFYFGEEITVTVFRSLKSVENNSLSGPDCLRFSTFIKNSPSIPAVFIDFESFRDPNNILHASTAADIDNDGDIDLIYAGNVGTGWLENIENNDYIPHLIIEKSWFMYEIKVADIDRDGDLDILTATIPQGICLLMNDGNENFTFTQLTSNAQSLSLDIADLDSNGLPDIIYSDWTTNVKKTFILSNNGNSFSNDVISNTGAIKNRVIDFDKDGDWDMVQHDYSQIRLLLNNAGTYASVSLATGTINDFVVSDFDNDGDQDIVASEDTILKMYVNDGALNFEVKVIESGKYYSIIQSGDFDGDNDVDLIVPDYMHFKMLVNDGLNNFEPIEVQNSHSSFGNINPYSIGTADLNSDGDLDFYSVINYFQIKCYSNASLGDVYPFSSASTSIKPFTDGDADWGDYDNDGDLDLLMMGIYQSNPVTILYENIEGQLVENATQLPGLAFGSCNWGDYDNDGDLDILLMGASSLSFDNRNPVSYIYTNDSGNFNLLLDSEIQLPKTWHGKAKWADFNNDGWLDIVFNANGYSGIYQSDGNGNFFRKFDLPTVFTHGNVDVGDYDSDGDLDIGVTGWRGNDELGTLLKVFRNEGNWNFSEAHGDFIGRIGGNLSWADMDNDGDLDLVVSGQIRHYGGGGYPSITVYSNQDTLFRLIENSEFLYQTDEEGTTSVGDYNNDGVTDVIASTQGGSSYSPDLTLLKNTGQGDLKTVDIELPNIASRVANWVDYDLDHDLDIFVQTDLLRNNSDVKNTPPSPPTFIQVDSVYNNSIYLQWDAGDDLETEKAGLSYQIYLGTNSNSQNIVNSNSHLATGFRKVAELGNSKGNFTKVENLKGGNYFFGVQSIDAGFEGSKFTNEGQVLVIGIHGNAGVCRELENSYVAEPAGAYQWEVSGGTIIAGQGTDSLVVHWTSSGVGFVKVSNAQGDRNTFPIHIDEIPNPIIGGDITVCTGLEIYTITDPLSHYATWMVTGENRVVSGSAHSGTFEWLLPGQFEVIVQAFPEHKGCSGYDTLQVDIDQRPKTTITGSDNTCMDQVEKYSTELSEAKWEVLNGTIVSAASQFVDVKWTAEGMGNVILSKESARAYCTSVDSLLITINPSPSKPVLTIFQDTIVLSTPSPTDYYQWYYESQLVISGPYIGVVPFPGADGAIVVEVFGQNGCGRKSDPFFFTITGIKEPVVVENNLRLYPNPADKKINVELSDHYLGSIRAQIYSSSGGLAKEVKIQKTSEFLYHEIDVSEFDKGCYILIVKTLNSFYSVRFIKL